MEYSIRVRDRDKALSIRLSHPDCRAAWERPRGAALSDVVLRPAVEQLAMIAARTISPLELAEEHIAQIEGLNPKLNALVDFDAERVRSQARALECVPGIHGPLHGLPMTVKASIAVAGYRCETGSLLNRGNIPSQDAVVVGRMRR